MAERYPGGVISKTPPTVTGPAPGTGGYASGVWTLDEVLGYQKAGTWPGQALPFLEQLYTWGNNNNGQVGDNTIVNKSSPVQIGSNAGWSSVFSASLTMWGITTDNRLYSWGQGTNGKLGHGDTVSKSSPTQVGALTNWSQVSGFNFFIALKMDGTLWSCGLNSTGQLGQSDVVSRSSPVQVGSLTDWAWVSTTSQGCTAIKTNGTMWSWGANGFGGLGLNDTANRSSPVQVGALTNWYRSNGGNAHMVATKTDGTIWAWGINDFFGIQGMLGLGDGINRSSPTQIGALTNWDRPATGTSGFASGALKTDNTLWTWGKNDVGALGVGDTTNRNSPVQVSGSWVFASLGYDSAAGIKTGGTLWSWGYNNVGRLGLGNTTNYSSPVQVGSETNWSAVCAERAAAAISVG